MNARAINTLSLAFKAIALGMAVLSVILTAVKVTTQMEYAVLVAIGLFCLALASVINHPRVP